MLECQPDMFEAEGDLFLNGLLGDIELPGNLPVGELLFPAEFKDMEAVFRQVLQGLGQQLFSFFMQEWLLINNIGCDLCQPVIEAGADALLTDGFQHLEPGSCAQVGSQCIYLCFLPPFPEGEEHFLHGILRQVLMLKDMISGAEQYIPVPVVYFPEGAFLFLVEGPEQIVIVPPGVVDFQWQPVLSGILE